jgi:hypothetical protein
VSDDRNQRAAVRLIKQAATRVDLEKLIVDNVRARAAHWEATTDSLVRGNGRTCDNCASSAPTNPKPRCYVCAGPTSTISRWEPKP